MVLAFFAICLLQLEAQSSTRHRCGRTGALPFVGVGWYRTDYKVSENDLHQKVQLLFDGAMSNAKVYVNGAYDKNILEIYSVNYD